jgi:hypothetical protein
MKLWSFDVRSEGEAAIPLTARLGQPEGLSPGLYIMISQGVPVGW